MFMRYAAAVLAIIVVAFLSIIFVASKGGKSSTSTSSTAKKVTIGKRLATQNDLNMKVSMTMQGKLTGDDTFRSVRITVDANERLIEVLSGYNGTVELNQSFGNNQAALVTFLYALDNAGFTNTQKGMYKDSRGVCPKGNVYQYTYTAQDGVPHDSWSTSCKRMDGTFAGDATVIKQLFQAQITDYDKVVKGVKL